MGSLANVVANLGFFEPGSTSQRSPPAPKWSVPSRPSASCPRASVGGRMAQLAGVWIVGPGGGGGGVGVGGGGGGAELHAAKKRGARGERAERARTRMVGGC